MEPDFSLLFSELNLPADCSLEQFKCAYRRRVAELHPDRKGSGPPSPEAQTVLPALISTYMAVNRFHHRYGRMPGASSRLCAGNPPRPAQLAARTTSPSMHTPPADPPARPDRPTVPLVIFFIALFLLLASWDWLTSST